MKLSKNETVQKPKKLGPDNKILNFTYNIVSYTIKLFFEFSFIWYGYFFKTKYFYFFCPKWMSKMDTCPKWMSKMDTCPKWMSKMDTCPKWMSKMDTCPKWMSKLDTCPKWMSKMDIWTSVQFPTPREV